MNIHENKEQIKRNTTCVCDCNSYDFIYIHETKQHKTQMHVYIYRYLHIKQLCVAMLLHIVVLCGWMLDTYQNTHTHTHV